jgi:GTP-binding protein Era
MLERLPEGEARYPADYLTDQPERFFAAEIVREQLLQATHDELPFSSAVVVDRFEELAEGRDLMRLFCTIVVDRESQKPIVVGRGGELVKRIGTAARGARTVLRDARLPGPARQGEVGMARRRACAGRYRAGQARIARNV